jgi:hypothetical protein
MADMSFHGLKSARERRAPANGDTHSAAGAVYMLAGCDACPRKAKTEAAR